VTTTIIDPPLDNPHTYKADVHYRLYLDLADVPVVITVQDFDYPDYDDERFLTTDAYQSEDDADIALHALLTTYLDRPDAAYQITRARMVVATGRATRDEAIFAAFPDPPRYLVIDAATNLTDDFGDGLAELLRTARKTTTSLRTLDEVAADMLRAGVQYPTAEALDEAIRRRMLGEMP
jgi:hypothetical protein